MIYLIILIVFVWYVANNLSELEKLIDAFAQGNWLWLIVAALIHVLFFALFTLMTQLSFRLVHLKRTFFELIPLVFGSIFANVIIPSVGQSGTVLYADDAARRKESMPKAVVGTLIGTVCSYAAFSAVLVFSLIYLKSVNMLNSYEVIGAIVFFFPAFAPAFLVFMARRNPRLTTKMLDGIYWLYLRIMKMFKKEPKVGEDWPKMIAGEIFEAADLIAKNRLILIETLIVAFLTHAACILSLFVIFKAFGLSIHYGALIAGYAVGELVRIISPHPEGVGVTEAAMAVIFASFGIPIISATAISLIFRAYNFWIPLGVGFALIKKTRSFSSKKT